MWSDGDVWWSRCQCLGKPVKPMVLDVGFEWVCHSRPGPIPGYPHRFVNLWWTLMMEYAAQTWNHWCHIPFWSIPENILVSIPEWPYSPGTCDPWNGNFGWPLCHFKFLWIPAESTRMTGFWQESVGHDKDLSCHFYNITKKWAFALIFKCSYIFCPLLLLIKWILPPPQHLKTSGDRASRRRMDVLHPFFQQGTYISCNIIMHIY